MRTATLFVTLLTLALGFACNVEPEVQRSSLENALVGDFGDVAVDDSNILDASLQLFEGEGYTSLSAQIVAPIAQGGALMAGLSIDQLDLFALPAGTTLHTEWESSGIDGPMEDEWVGPTVSVIGPDGEDLNPGDANLYGYACSGDTADQWDEDAPAEEIDIIIVEGPDGERGLELDMQFANEQALSGLLVLENIEVNQDDWYGEPIPLEADAQ